ncbi:MAG TPA: thiamine phosphate synthase [Herpetosiphonaceae bacterium]
MAERNLPAARLFGGRPPLYVVFDLALAGDRPLEALARAVLRGGAALLQLRAKGRPLREQAAAARRLLPLCAEHGVPLLINDHVDLALAVGAAGAHLGVDDLPVALARAIMPGGLIGYSPDGVEDARQAGAADYLGVGPFAATGTKRDAGAPIGAAGIGLLAALPVPVVAIGGITRSNAPLALSAGAAGVAVASAVLAAADPELASRQLADALARAREAA